MSAYQTKDSGKREEYTSGMVRDTQEQKPRYDLIDLAGLKRVAELMARGAAKYGERNWEKANSREELNRFRASAFRHFVQYMAGERDEDHMAAVVFNLFAMERVRELQEFSPNNYINPNHYINTLELKVDGSRSV